MELEISGRIEEWKVKYAALALAICALGAGLVAAFYWYASGRVNLPRPWTRERLVEGHNLAWETDLLIALSVGARLNQKAAIWTAIALLLSTISAVLGAWPTSN